MQQICVIIGQTQWKRENDLKIKLMEKNIQIKVQREQTRKEIKRIWDKMSKSNICVVRVPKEKARKMITNI